MTWQGFLQIFVLLAVVGVLGKLFGDYMFNVFEGGKTFLDRALVPVERATYRLCGIDPSVEMRWTSYVFAILAVNAVGFVVLFLLIGLQPLAPLNPAKEPAVPFWVAINTAVSFVTNTNWQVYAGESTMSYLTQMWLTVQQFVSPVTGLVILLAVVRGFSRSGASTLGNFWRDFIRGLLWVSLPFSLVAAVVLAALGSPQNLGAYTKVTTLSGAHQVIAQGPVASMTAIMQWGDNGGGFFNMNAAHPFEAPNAASLFFQLVLGFVVPVGCVFLFGRMIRDLRQSRPIFGAMAVLFVLGAVLLYVFEAAGSPALAAHHVVLANHHNMEGKEARFGIGTTSLFENSTTAVSWGSVAASNDSLTPLGGLITLFNMKTGEVIFGSWGVGMVGMLAYAVLTLFLAGLMVGRTPEYLGKKIESYEVKMAILSMVIPSFVILILAALSVSLKAGLAGIFNPGPHGLSEVLYAFTSGVGNNGSAFGGLSSASPWYSATVGLAMLLGRFPMYIPLVAMAGSLAAKKSIPQSAGTFPTHGPLFAGLLVGTVVVVGALIFFPALALGPLAEQFAARSGQLFG